MKLSFAPLLLAAAAIPASIEGYDVGCLYPPDMPDPMAARFHLHQWAASYLMKLQVETPIVIHTSTFSSLCQTNCLAYHDKDLLDGLTLAPPLLRVPEEYHNSWSRMLCIAQCFQVTSEEAGEPDFYNPIWDKWGLGPFVPRRDAIGLGVLAAQQSGDPTPLRNLLEKEDYHPFTVGQIVATEILLSVTNDGWNALGMYTYDTATGEQVECSANCERYKDTIGYFPKNHPTGKRENWTKYIVEGNDRHWQPLVDNDMNGYFSAQLHVTPHIGYKAKAKLYDSVDDMPQAPDPQYDYREEALKVVERLAVTAGDDIMKQKVAFFDNKLLVINLIESEVKRQFSSDYSFEEELLYIEGMSAGEHDATLMAWREKVRHDLVRPTTVIQRWGNDVLNTFGGDKSVNGPVEIKARDFQAFQRVMPHSEYPSGSSCICTAYTEFTDEFTKAYYNDTVKDLPFGEAGEGRGYGCGTPDFDPPIFVAKGCNMDFTIPDMKTLLHECSQSRLWAGFHFTAAVTEGEALCEGVGVKAWEHVKKIRNGSTLGQKFYEGDARPQCLDESMAVWRKPNGDADVAELESEASSASSTFKTLAVAAASALIVFFSI